MANKVRAIGHCFIARQCPFHLLHEELQVQIFEIQSGPREDVSTALVYVESCLECDKVVNASFMGDGVSSKVPNEIRCILSRLRAFDGRMMPPIERENASFSNLEEFFDNFLPF